MESGFQSDLSAKAEGLAESVTAEFRKWEARGKGGLVNTGAAEGGVLGMMSKFQTQR